VSTRATFQKNNLYRFAPYAIITVLVFLIAARPAFADGLFGLPTLSDLMANALQSILSIFLYLLSFAANLMDFAMTEFVFGMSDFIDKTPAIKNIWAIFRDIANIFFIFILLYAGIATILGTLSGSAKRILASVVVAALLINFSFFLTGFVIDISNVISTEFYNNIQLVDAAGHPVDAGKIQGLGDAFNASLRAGSLKNIDLSKTGDDINTQIMTVGLVGSLFALVATFVFAAIALLLTIRFAILLLLLIFAPLAFAARTLPQTQRHWNTWSQSLFSNAIFAPALIMMCYVTLQLINSYNASVATEAAKGLGEALQTGGSLDAILVYILAIIFLVASVVIAKQLGAAGGTTINSYGKKLYGKGRAKLNTMTGAATFGLAGAAARNTLGRSAYNSLQGESGAKLRSLTTKGGVVGWTARKALNTNEKLAGASFDARNTDLVDKKWGKGQKGGYQNMIKTEVDKHKKEMKRVGEQNLYEKEEIKRIKEDPTNKDALKKYNRFQGVLNNKKASSEQKKRAARALDGLARSDAQIKHLIELEAAPHKRQEDYINNVAAKKNMFAETAGKITRVQKETLEKLHRDLTNLQQELVQKRADLSQTNDPAQKQAIQIEIDQIESAISAANEQVTKVRQRERTWADRTRNLDVKHDAIGSQLLAALKKSSQKKSVEDIIKDAIKEENAAQGDGEGGNQ
jgi:hypothetical protein